MVGISFPIFRKVSFHFQLDICIRLNIIYTEKKANRRSFVEPGFAGIGARGLSHHSADDSPYAISALASEDHYFGHPQTQYPAAAYHDDPTSSYRVNQNLAPQSDGYSPESLYDAEISTASRTKVIAPSIVPTVSSSRIAPSNDYDPYTINPYVRQTTQPLVVRKSTITASSSSHSTRAVPLSARPPIPSDDAYQRPLHPILKSNNSASRYAEPTSYHGQRNDSLRRDNRSEPKTQGTWHQTGKENHLHRDEDGQMENRRFHDSGHSKGSLSDNSNNTTTPAPAKSHYTPSSGRPAAKGYDSRGGNITSPFSTSTVTGFPLPPTTLAPTTPFSALEPSTSLPYFRSNRRDTRTLALAAGIPGSPNSLAESSIERPKESPSMGLASVGGLMLQDFEFEGSGEEGDLDFEFRDDSRTLRDVGDGQGSFYSDRDRYKNRYSAYDYGKEREDGRTRGIVPSITITTTPSADNLRGLAAARKLRRLTLSQQSSGNGVDFGQDSSTTLADPEAYTNKSFKFPKEKEAAVPTPDWAPLSQTTLERTQPNYRSTTYSIYGMYGDEEAAPMPPPPRPFRGDDSFGSIYDRERGEQVKKSKPMKGDATLSGIYSGYGLGRTDEDLRVGASNFAQEVGASLGKIRGL